MDELVLKDPQKPAGPVKVRRLTIVVDHEVCIGSAICPDFAPLTFALNEMGQSVVLASADKEEEKAILEAANACPMNAITVFDEEHNKIAPK